MFDCTTTNIIHNQFNYLHSTSNDLLTKPASIGCSVNIGGTRGGCKGEELSRLKESSVCVNRDSVTLARVSGRAICKVTEASPVFIGSLTFACKYRNGRYTVGACLRELTSSFLRHVVLSTIRFFRLHSIRYRFAPLSSSNFPPF